MRLLVALLIVVVVLVLFNLPQLSELQAYGPASAAGTAPQPARVIPTDQAAQPVSNRSSGNQQVGP